MTSIEIQRDLAKNGISVERSAATAKHIKHIPTKLLTRLFKSERLAGKKLPLRTCTGCGRDTRVATGLCSQCVPHKTHHTLASRLDDRKGRKDNPYFHMH